MTTFENDYAELLGIVDLGEDSVAQDTTEDATEQWLAEHDHSYKASQGLWNELAPPPGAGAPSPFSGGMDAQLGGQAGHLAAEDSSQPPGAAQKSCAHCDEPLTAVRLRRKKFCSSACKMQAYRRRKDPEVGSRTRRAIQLTG